MSLPPALRPLVAFAQALRGAGFAVAPDQTVGFVEAVGLLGPRDVEDIRRAGRALFAVPPERVADYDALFDALFLGRLVAAEAGGPEDEEVEAHEPTGARAEVEADEGEVAGGQEATAAERLGRRGFGAEGEEEALARLARMAPARLPRRRSYRRQPARRGDRPDLRRSLRAAARRDGEVLWLFATRRRTRQRRVLLLVDVSGSMRSRTEASLRLSHALVHAAERAEVFTLGTRLTRVTAELGPADQARALARASAAVADIDGGTRIGEALQSFLAVPRYAGLARGAAIVVLSDGLERGGPEAMVDAVARLSRLAWRLDWLTPLMADPGYRPATAGLAAVLPWLDALGDGSETRAAVAHILGLARAA